MAEKSLLGSLFKWAFLAAVVYFGATVAWPTLRDRFQGATGPGGDCSRAATRAYRDFATDKHPFIEHGQDPVAWEELRTRTEGQIRTARATCACRLEACDKGRRAVDQIEQLLHVFDGAAQRRATVANTSDLESTIERLLGEARALARDNR